MNQIARNITTNEMANMMRYSYLRDPNGRFRNPYDHGIWNNCHDFLVNGQNTDVVLPLPDGPSLAHTDTALIQLAPCTVNGSSNALEGTNGSSGVPNAKSCCDNHKKDNGLPLGLGLGLGNKVRHNVRPLAST